MFKTRNRKDAEILEQEGFKTCSIINLGRNFRGKPGETTIKEIGFNCEEKDAIETLKRRKREDLERRLEEEGTASAALLLEQKIKELKEGEIKKETPKEEEKEEAKQEDEKKEDPVVKKKKKKKKEKTQE